MTAAVWVASARSAMFRPLHRLRRVEHTRAGGRELRGNGRPVTHRGVVGVAGHPIGAECRDVSAFTASMIDGTVAIAVGACADAHAPSAQPGRARGGWVATFRRRYA